MCIDDNINKVKGASGKLEEKRVYLAMEMSIQEWKGGFVLKKDIRDLWTSTISKLSLIDRWMDR